MTENIAEEAEVASPETPTTPVTPEPAMTPRQAETLRGQSEALNRIKAEAAQSAKDLAAAREQLAQFEQQNMSELEKAQRERDSFKTQAEEAKAEARRVRMEATYPNAAKDYEGEPLPSEDVLKRQEARYATAEVAAPAASRPVINPAKSPAPPKQTIDEKREDLAAAWQVERAAFDGTY